MPHQIRLVRPVVTVSGKLDLPADHSFEKERGVAGFVEAVGGDEHPVLVVERPQAGIEHPVRVLGKREAVLRMVVAAIGELVDVGGVHDATRVYRDATVAGQGAGVVVRGHNGKAEARFASELPRYRIAFDVFFDDSIRFDR